MNITTQSSGTFLRLYSNTHAPTEGTVTANEDSNQSLNDSVEISFAAQTQYEQTFTSTEEPTATTTTSIDPPAGGGKPPALPPRDDDDS